MCNNCSCWFCVDIYLMMTHNRLSEIFGLQILLIFMFILCWCLFLFGFNVRKRVIWGKDEEIFVSQMSRYLFPLLFALFNIFYWSHYLNQVFTLSIVYFPQKWVHLFKNWNYPREKKDALFGVGENCLFLTSYVFISPIPGTEGVWLTEPNRKEIISSLKATSTSQLDLLKQDKHRSKAQKPKSSKALVQSVIKTKKAAQIFRLCQLLLLCHNFSFQLLSPIIGCHF